MTNKLVALVTGASSGIGEATGHQACSSRLQRLWHQPTCGQIGPASLPDAGA